MHKFDDLSISEKYIVLALAADEIAEDQSIVFHYFGPKDLCVYVGAWKEKGAQAIGEELRKLEGSIPDNINDAPPLFRRSFLTSQIRSLRGLLEFGTKKLTGEALIRAVKSTLAIDPPPPYNINDIKKEERSILSHYHYNSYSEFKKEREAGPKGDVSDKALMDWIDRLKASCKADIVPHLYRGEALSPILDSSEVRLARPDEGYPPCYYVYNGGGRGTISLTDDHHKKDGLTALRTLIHEIYPGHHFYYLYREMLYKCNLLAEEATIDLLYSAETPVNEGVAETAFLFLGSLGDEVRRDVEVATAREHYCKKVLYNVWYDLFVEQKMSRVEAVQYLRDEGGFEPGEDVERWINFVDDWRLYYPSYPLGTAAMRRYIEESLKGGLRYLYLPKPISVLERLIKFNKEDV